MARFDGLILWFLLCVSYYNWSNFNMRLVLRLHVSRAENSISCHYPLACVFSKESSITTWIDSMINLGHILKTLNVLLLVEYPKNIPSSYLESIFDEPLCLPECSTIRTTKDMKVFHIWFLTFSKLLIRKEISWMKSNPIMDMTYSI